MPRTLAIDRGKAEGRRQADRALTRLGRASRGQRAHNGAATTRLAAEVLAGGGAAHHAGRTGDGMAGAPPGGIDDELATRIG